MIEVDAEFDLEAIVRFEARRFVPVRHADRFQYADEFFCDRLLFDARRLQ